MEFPIGKKLFHLVVNPRYVAVPDRGPGTGINYEKRANRKRSSVRKSQPGKQAHLFKFSTFSGNFPVDEPTNETCSIYRRTQNSGNFVQMESAPENGFKRRSSAKFRRMNLSKVG